MLYWLPATGASSIRLYWESYRRRRMDPVEVPTGVTQFPRGDDPAAAALAGAPVHRPAVLVRARGRRPLRVDGAAGGVRRRGAGVLPDGAKHPTPGLSRRSAPTRCGRAGGFARRPARSPPRPPGPRPRRRRAGPGSPGRRGPGSPSSARRLAQENSSAPRGPAAPSPPLVGRSAARSSAAVPASRTWNRTVRPTSTTSPTATAPVASSASRMPRPRKSPRSARRRTRRRRRRAASRGPSRRRATGCASRPPPAA